MPPATRSFARATPLIFFAAAAFTLVVALMPQPPYTPTGNLSDKLDHIIGFSVLGTLAALAWPQAPRLLVVERLSFFGAFIEVAQSIPALGRDCDILDWVADTLAVIVVTGVVALLRRRRVRG